MKKGYLSICFGLLLFFNAPCLSVSQESIDDLTNTNNGATNLSQGANSYISNQSQNHKQWVNTIKPEAGHLSNNNPKAHTRLPYWKQTVKRHGQRKMNSLKE